jgi:TrmH family RNA methyltransferase
VTAKPALSLFDKLQHFRNEGGKLLLSLFCFVWYNAFMEIITSSSNKIVKQIRALREKKGRDLARAFLVEGAKFVAEIGPDWEILRVVMSESHAAGVNCVRPPLGCAPIIVTDRIFAALSDTTTPQGVMAVVAQREFGFGDVVKGERPLVFVLEEINDPGNLGTILRSCYGLGADGVILSESCADIFGPKTIRASAGAVFHMPFVVMDAKEAINALKTRGVAVYAASPAADKSVYELDLQKPAAFILGNEHKGLKPETAALADCGVKIPIYSESLNVSAACAILAYEALKQRKMQK